VKKVLLVSPHFPPTNAPDMQRVRMSLPHFEAFGWKPFVLSAAPAPTDVVEPLFEETIPANVQIERVKHLPLALTRVVGVENVAIRALPYLYSAGSRLIRVHNIDLVFFSTTMFLAMPLGRMWKRRLGVPYVLDFQDPWLSDYYETHPEVAPPPKYRAARRVHAVMEPWTIKRVDGIISVSPQYIETLQERYPRVRSLPTMTLPFGAAQEDFDVVARHPQANRHFSPQDGRTHGVYAGRGGQDLATALDILFRAFQLNQKARPIVFDHVVLHFVGTDYAPAGRAQKTIAPAAERAGVSAWVEEDTTRLPYFETLQLLKDASFLMIVGSDDPAYSASKIYPYILARKPLLAIVHERSPLVEVLRDTRAGVVVTFPSAPTGEQRASAARQLAGCWQQLVEGPRSPETDWARFQPYTAREMARRQCELFDGVLARRGSAVAS
jgi:Glycosyl transferase 4-like domain